MDTQSNLSNHFLIAMPGLNDPNFFHTVTYICEHNEKGAMGIVINRPIEFSIADIFEHMDISTDPSLEYHQPVFNGGPVQEDRGFILHQYDHDWDSTLIITPGIAITTSKDILEALAKGKGPDKNLVALGYAGWGAGQLEQEIIDNAWLTGPARPEILFDLPVEDRWQQAATDIGVDLNLLSTTSGHA